MKSPSLIDAVYRQLRSEGDGDLLRPHHGARLQQACKAGISFGKDDMVIPKTKEKIVEARRAKLVRSSSSSTTTA
jgi:DNA-directed RNA polymerase subunit beta'